VFAGGFGLAAAEAVAAHPDVPTAEVVGLLGALVDKGLLQFGDTGAGPGRYRLLETVRQYAAGRLEAQGPAAANQARAAHRDYYLALAEAAGQELAGPDQGPWLDRLDAELGNLRAAIAFSMTQPDPEPGLRLAASLRVFWRIRGHAAEGASLLQALLDAPAAQGTTLARARALRAAAQVLEATTSFAIVAGYCQEALEIARAAGDDYLAADLLQARAWGLVFQGDPGTALPLIERGLGLARRLGEPLLTSRLMSTRSYAAYVAGDPASAVRDAAEALRLSRQAADRLQVGQMLGNLGNFELAADDLEAARGHLAESLDIARELNSRDGIVFWGFNLGLAEYLAGSPGAAEALFAESLGLAQRTGMKLNMAYALLGLAMASSGADPGWSARMHGAADQAMADLGHAFEPFEGGLADRDRQRLRAAMGEAFDAEYAAGRSLDPAEVLAEAGRKDTSAVPGRALGSGEAALVLTPRELDVLRLVAQGSSNADIARRLFLSEHTVHRHLANILRKLNLSTRAAAAAWGVRSGLV
jgi:non-specific serine/threonine protein kinase